MRAFAAFIAVVAAAASLGCGKPVDLKQGLRVQVVSTGWADGGLVDGKNKIVPALSFTMTNTSGEKLPVLQANAIFRRVNEQAEWGSGLLTVAGSDGLAPAATTANLTIRSQRGYTGVESRAEMLQNSQFVDANVQLFAK